MKILMKKLFWPLVSAIFTVVVLVLWFSAPGMNDQPAPRMNSVFEQNIHLPADCSYEVIGNDIILRGRVNDKAERDKIIASIKAIPGVGEVRSELSFLPQRAMISFCLSVDVDSVTLSGSIPHDLDHDLFMRAVESQKPGLAVYDELAGVAGDFPLFSDRITYLIQLLSEISEGKIALSDSQILVDDINIKRISEQNTLPAGMTIHSMGQSWDNAKCAIISNEAHL